MRRLKTSNIQWLIRFRELLKFSFNLLTERLFSPNLLKTISFIISQFRKYTHLLDSFITPMKAFVHPMTLTLDDQTNTPSIDEQLEQKQTALQDLRNRVLQNLGMYQNPSDSSDTVQVDLVSQNESERLSIEQNFFNRLVINEDTSQAVVSPFELQLDPQREQENAPLSGADSESRDNEQNDLFTPYLPVESESHPEETGQAALRQEASGLLEELLPKGSFNPNHVYQQICAQIDEQTSQTDQTAMERAMVADFKMALWQELRREVSQRIHTWQSTQSRTLDNHLYSETYNLVTRHPELVRISELAERAERNPAGLTSELLTCSEEDLLENFPVFSRNPELKQAIDELRNAKVRVESLTLAHARALFSSDETARQRALQLPSLAAFQEDQSTEQSSNDLFDRVVLANVPELKQNHSTTPLPLQEFRALHGYISQNLAAQQLGRSQFGTSLNSDTVAALLEAPIFDMQNGLLSDYLNNLLQSARHQRFHIIMDALEVTLQAPQFSQNNGRPILTAPPPQSGWQLTWQPHSQFPQSQGLLDQYRYQFHQTHDFRLRFDFQHEIMLRGSLNSTNGNPLFNEQSPFRRGFGSQSHSGTIDFNDPGLPRQLRFNTNSDSIDIEGLPSQARFAEAARTFEQLKEGQTFNLNGHDSTAMFRVRLQTGEFQPALTEQSIIPDFNVQVPLDSLRESYTEVYISQLADSFTEQCDAENIYRERDDQLYNQLLSDVKALVRAEVQAQLLAAIDTRYEILAHSRAEALSTVIAMQLHQEYSESALIHSDAAIATSLVGFNDEFIAQVSSLTNDKILALQEQAPRTQIVEGLKLVYASALSEECSLEQLQERRDRIRIEIDESDLSSTTKELLHQQNDKLFCETIIEQINIFAQDDLTEDIDYRGFEVFLVYDDRAAATEPTHKYYCVSIIDPNEIRERTVAVCEQFPEFTQSDELLVELQHASQRLGLTRALLWQERSNEAEIQYQMEKIKEDFGTIGLEISAESNGSTAIWTTTRPTTLEEICRVTFALEPDCDIPDDFYHRLINSNPALAETFADSPDQDYANFAIPSGTELLLEESTTGLYFKKLLLMQEESSLRQIAGFASVSFPELAMEQEKLDPIIARLEQLKEHKRNLTEQHEYLLLRTEFVSLTDDVSKIKPGMDGLYRVDDFLDDYATRLIRFQRQFPEAECHVELSTRLSFLRANTYQKLAAIRIQEGNQRGGEFWIEKGHEQLLTLLENDALSESPEVQHQIRSRQAALEMLRLRIVLLDERLEAVLRNNGGELDLDDEEHAEVYNRLRHELRNGLTKATEYVNDIDDVEVRQEQDEQLSLEYIRLQEQLESFCCRPDSQYELLQRQLCILLNMQHLDRGSTRRYVDGSTGRIVRGSHMSQGYAAGPGYAPPIDLALRTIDDDTIERLCTSFDSLSETDKEHTFQLLEQACLTAIDLGSQARSKQISLITALEELAEHTGSEAHQARVEIVKAQLAFHLSNSTKDNAIDGLLEYENRYHERLAVLEAEWSNKQRDLQERLNTCQSQEERERLLAEIVALQNERTEHLAAKEQIRSTILMMATTMVRESRNEEHYLYIVQEKRREIAADTEESIPRLQAQIDRLNEFIDQEEWGSRNREVAELQLQQLVKQRQAQRERVARLMLQEVELVAEVRGVTSARNLLNTLKSRYGSTVQWVDRRVEQLLEHINNGDKGALIAATQQALREFSSESWQEMLAYSLAGSVIGGVIGTAICPGPGTVAGILIGEAIAIILLKAKNIYCGSGRIAQAWNSGYCDITWNQTFMDAGFAAIDIVFLAMPLGGVGKVGIKGVGKGVLEACELEAKTLLRAQGKEITEQSVKQLTRKLYREALAKEIVAFSQRGGRLVLGGTLSMLSYSTISEVSIVLSSDLSPEEKAARLASFATEVGTAIFFSLLLNGGQRLAGFGSRIAPSELRRLRQTYNALSNAELQGAIRSTGQSGTNNLGDIADGIKNTRSGDTGGVRPTDDALREVTELLSQRGRRGPDLGDGGGGPPLPENPRPSGGGMGRSQGDLNGPAPSSGGGTPSIDSIFSGIRGGDGASLMGDLSVRPQDTHIDSSTPRSNSSNRIQRYLDGESTAGQIQNNAQRQVGGSDTATVESATAVLEPPSQSRIDDITISRTDTHTRTDTTVEHSVQRVQNQMQAASLIDPGNMSSSFSSLPEHIVRDFEDTISALGRKHSQPRTPVTNPVSPTPHTRQVIEPRIEVDVDIPSNVPFSRSIRPFEITPVVDLVERAHSSETIDRSPVNPSFEIEPPVIPLSIRRQQQRDILDTNNPTPVLDRSIRPLITTPLSPEVTVPTEHLGMSIRTTPSEIDIQPQELPLERAHATSTMEPALRSDPIAFEIELPLSNLTRSSSHHEPMLTDPIASLGRRVATLDLDVETAASFPPPLQSQTDSIELAPSEIAIEMQRATVSDTVVLRRPSEPVDPSPAYDSTQLVRRSPIEHDVPELNIPRLERRHHVSPELVQPSIEISNRPVVSTRDTVGDIEPVEIEMQRSVRLAPIEIPLRTPSVDTPITPLEVAPLTRRRSIPDPLIQPEIPLPARSRVPNPSLELRQVAQVATNDKVDTDFDFALKPRSNYNPYARLYPRPQPLRQYARQKLMQETQTKPKPKRYRRGDYGGAQGTPHDWDVIDRLALFEKNPSLYDIKRIEPVERDDHFIGKHYRRRYGKKSAWQGGDEDEVFDFERTFEYDRGEE